MHDNLIGFVETRREAYGLLVKHQERDLKRRGWIFGAIFLVLIAYSEGWIDAEYGLRVAIGAGALFVYGLILSLDASNREFTLHLIDWMEAIESKRMRRDQ